MFHNATNYQYTTPAHVPKEPAAALKLPRLYSTHPMSLGSQRPKVKLPIAESSIPP